MTIFEDLLFQDNSFFVCCSSILAATSGLHCRHLLPKTLSSIARIKARKRKLLPIIVPLQYFRLFFKIFLFFACSSKILVIRIQLCYFTCYFIMSQHHSENSMKGIASHIFLFFEGGAVVMQCIFSIGVQTSPSHSKTRSLE